MFLLVLFVLLCLLNSVEICLSSFRVPLTLEFEHLEDFSQLVSFGLDSRRFSHVPLDLVGPLSSSHSFTYLLTMIDRTTRWPEVALLSSFTAESCVRAYLFSWVARFGVPLVFTSDPGSNSPPQSGLESAVLDVFLHLLLRISIHKAMV